MGRLSPENEKDGYEPRVDGEQEVAAMGRVNQILLCRRAGKEKEIIM